MKKRDENEPNQMISLLVHYIFNKISSLIFVFLQGIMDLHHDIFFFLILGLGFFELFLETAECAGQNDASSSSANPPEDEAGTSGAKPSSVSSPVPSISSRGESWIEEAYGTEASSYSTGVGPQAPLSPPLPRVETPGISQEVIWRALEEEAPEQAAAPPAPPVEPPAQPAQPAQPKPGGPQAAGPSDCWTGQPDERLLRAMDKKLSRIAEENKALAEKVVEKAALFGIRLPGSPAEQKETVSIILDNHLDDIDVDRRLRKIRRWDKESEVGSPDSSFWIMIENDIEELEDNYKMEDWKRGAVDRE